MIRDSAFDWGVHDVPDGQTTSLSLGPLELRFRCKAGEIHVATRLPGDPPGPRWSRWVPNQGWDGRIELRPAFPDRPIVVKPEDEFWLLKDAEARIYVRVPLFVRIDALGTLPRTIMTAPTRILSDTWWGNPEEGELCYFLDTRARRSMAADEFLENSCVCPLQLINRSPDDLLVTRIALRPTFLSIYREGDRLWSNTTRVRYQGEEEESILEVEERPPAEADDPVMVTPAVERMARGFTARTFARLRSSLGGWI